MRELPGDYLERAYAGVLGKLIGVYLGRPFEGWTYERIMRELGPIEDYVHERLNCPLVVTDDDVAGTFTFIRALEDHGVRADITAREIGETWLNYIVESRAILWWGGNGVSTEHTAWLNLARGIDAPRSGSIAVNGKTIAEQIGAQIFIDGWAIVAAGDPALAARLAGQAASVSHDGAAVEAAKLWAAMEAEAFVTRDVERLIDVGLAQISASSPIARLIADIRRWRRRHSDWRDARKEIARRYGYDKYPGNCHVVPNHALMIMALLYAGDDFSRAQTVVCTSGWDTDCNAGNVGCLMGAMLGLEGIDAGKKWRGPLLDRMLISSADGGGAINDAVRVSARLVDLGRKLAGLPPLPAPKEGAVFHFSPPGSVQGFIRGDHGEAELAICERPVRARQGVAAPLYRARRRACRRADADLRPAGGHADADLRADGDAACLSGRNRSGAGRGRSDELSRRQPRAASPRLCGQRCAFVAGFGAGPSVARRRHGPDVAAARHGRPADSIDRFGGELAGR